MFALARKLLPGGSSAEQSHKLVFQGELADEVDNPWMLRIVALADGRPSEEIAQVLYLEELRAGADLADIGVWRSLFFDQVDQTLKEMVERKYIRLLSPDLPSPESKSQGI